MTRWPILVAGLVLARLAPPAFAETLQCEANPDRFAIITAGDAAFARAIQAALAQNDRQWLADHTRYPLRASLDHKLAYIETRAEFLEKFDRLFGDEVTAGILRTDPGCLFKKDARVMMGAGRLWFVEYPAFASPTTRYLIAWLNTPD